MTIDPLITIYVMSSIAHCLLSLSVALSGEWWWWLIVAAPVVVLCGTMAMYLRLPRHERHLQFVRSSEGTVIGWVRSLRAYHARYGQDRLYWTTIVAAASNALAMVVLIVVIALKR